MTYDLDKVQSSLHVQKYLDFIIFTVLTISISYAIRSKTFLVRYTVYSRVFVKNTNPSKTVTRGFCRRPIHVTESKMP